MGLEIVPYPPANSFFFLSPSPLETTGLTHLVFKPPVIIISIRDGIVRFVGDPADVDGVVDKLLDDY